MAGSTSTNLCVLLSRLLCTADPLPPPNEQTQPTEPQGVPNHSLLARHESTHGVSDVNHVAWCRLSPSKAAATLRALEGGEEDPAEEDGGKGNGEKEEADGDERWKQSRDWFGSAGDDGVVRVWKVVDHGAEGEGTKTE